MNLLALSVSRKVQLIQSIKIACNHSSRKLYCADASIDSPALYFGDEYTIVPKIESGELLNYLLKYCKTNYIEFILPTSDQDLVFLTIVREELLNEGISVLMSKSSTIRNCISKFKFAEICRNNNFPVPLEYSDIEDIEFPCVGKINISSASKGVFYIKNKKELEALLDKYSSSELIFQEYIDSQEYTIDSFYGLNGNLICAIPRKRLKVLEGESIISETVYIPELVNLAKKLELVFQFYGHITIQAFFNKSGSSIIEVNPRFGGASNLSFVAGLKSPEWIVQLMNKNSNLIEVGEIKYNLKMLRYSKDYFYEV